MNDKDKFIIFIVVLITSLIHIIVFLYNLFPGLLGIIIITIIYFMDKLFGNTENDDMLSSDKVDKINKNELDISTLKYKIGDQVIHPKFGAGVICDIETKEILGKQKTFFVIEITYNLFRWRVPAEKVDEIGIRKVL